MTETQIIEQTARASYGKLLAILTKITNGDVALAEDILSESFLKALSHWPLTGVPSNPEGWIVSAAKNSMIDKIRHQKVKKESTILLLESLDKNESQFPDQRLGMIFACTHPAIATDIRTPLILQTILGLSVEQISSAFLISPSALEKRLTRAKKKIRDSAIPFEIPEKSELKARIEEVLESIYAAFGAAWNEMEDILESEALFLCQLVVELLPEEPEPKGLLSLMLFCSSRKKARRIDGVFIPLDRQDIASWEISSIQKAERLLQEASNIKSFGKFQLEAAIQSAHVDRLLRGVDNQRELLTLYRALITLHPSIGAWIAYGSAFLKFGQAQEAQKIILALEEGNMSKYQPYWVLKAEVNFTLKEFSVATFAIKTAIGLTEDVAVRKYLHSRFEYFSSAR